MRRRNKSTIALAVAGLLLNVLSANAQQTKKLDIGDPAPEIRYSKWLQGTPIASISDGKLYVVEFWATWCGACIGSMEHLSELSKKYEGKAVFIGADVQEHAKNQPYETTLPGVQAFIAGKLNKMTYPAFADNNDEYMKKTWMDAAGENGLPATYVINHGKLIWIGHPAMLDRMMDQFIDGTYDMQAFKKQFEQLHASMAASRAASEELQGAINKGDYQKALDLIEHHIATGTGPYYKMQKFQLLADHIDGEKAYAYLLELKDKNDQGAFEITRSAPGHDGMLKKIYELCIEILREKPADANMLYRIAMLQSKAGNLQDAIATDKKAIEMGKAEIAANTHDVVLQKNLTTYEDRLKEFQRAGK